MSDQSLREYTEEIRQLLDAGQADEALPRAQHLLQHFPRYWLGYRLLAEAALEQGHRRDAIEIFQRVLSVDPENFVAHAGLATAFDEEGDLEEALWHMMRAFEVNPGLREVRERMRQLYERRDGHAPGRLPTTRAALARGYLRDGWFERAAQELIKALEAEPNRVDVLSALAEAQWFAGQRQAAAESASAVLQELPYCLKSNLILGEFYVQEGDLDGAGPFLTAAQQLDPENDLAVRMFGPSGHLQARRVLVAIGMEEAGEPDGGVTRGDAGASDWLMGLSHATRTALDTLALPWQAALRRATLTALPTAQPEAVEAPQGMAWHAALHQATIHELGAFLEARGVDREAIPADAEPANDEVAEPGQPWGATDSALATPSPLPSEAALVPAGPRSSPWAERLLAETETFLATWQPAAPTPAAEPAPALYDWRGALYAETTSALATPAAPAPSQANGAGWKARLRGESVQALSALPTPATATDAATSAPLPAAGSTAAPGWIAYLRESTDEGLASAADTGPKSDGGASEAPPSWVAALRDATTAALDEGEGDDRTLADRLVGGVGGILHQVHEVADTLRRKATDSLSSLFESDDHATGSPPPADETDALAEQAEAFWDGETEVAGEQLEQEAEAFWTDPLGKPPTRPRRRTPPIAWEQTVAEMSREWAESAPETEPLLTDDPLLQPEEASSAEPSSSLAEADGQAAESSVTDTTMAKGADSADSLPAVPLSEMERAHQAWQAGNSREAYSIYQTLYLAGGAPAAELSVELEAWTRTGRAPALAHQLLADLYRRMGRMQEAVAQYREAINRM